MNTPEITGYGVPGHARSSGAEERHRDPTLWGRKSVLTGMAASIGSLFATDGQPPPIDDGTAKPAPGDPRHSDPSRATELGVNALRNGCMGDGVTDDTAALHAVRNTAASLGVPVYLPKATYLVTGLTLDKADQSWLLAKGATVLLAPSSRRPVISVTAAGVIVQGGKVDGNKGEQDAETSGISIDAAGATISHVEATNCHGNGISLLPKATGCLIENNYCHDNGKSTNAASGIYLREATLCRVLGNRCEHNGTSGNAILYDGNGIYLAGGKVVGYNLIANNQCSHNARRGIKLQELGATITGNVCVLNSTGIGVTNTPNPDNTPTVISGNMIKESALQGLQLDSCAFLTISGNTITDSGDHGVGAALGCSQVTMTGNTIARSARHGANLVGIHDWNISGNLILDNGSQLARGYGLHLDDDQAAGPCRRVNIVGNTSSNSGANTTQTHGFVVAGTSDLISLVGNIAGNAIAIPYQWARTVTYLTFWANTGSQGTTQGTPWTSFSMRPGSVINGTTDAAGFTLMQDPASRMGFWGQAPVRRPSAPPADATDLATAIALVNDLKAKLKVIGLTA